MYKIGENSTIHSESHVYVNEFIYLLLTFFALSSTLISLYSYFLIKKTKFILNYKIKFLIKMRKSEKILFIRLAK